MNVFAVVVTYNRKELLQECLDRILAQTRPLDRILIIDNASSDGTQQMLAEKHYLENPAVDYRLMNSNLGGAGGFYKGMKIARDANADWVWIMDDDTIPQENSLEHLLCQTDRYPNASFFASCVEGPAGEPMNVPVIDEGKAPNGYKKWYMPMKNGMVQIQMATFVSLLINGDAMRKCGLPCKDFFLWGDDSEYTLRLTRYYGPAYMAGDSWVCHKRYNAKKLGIQHENDPKRIANYHYLYRNLLIRYARYDGFIKFFFGIVKYSVLSIIMLFSRGGGTKKFLAIQKGIVEFIYQYRKFCLLINKELGKEAN